VEKSSFAKLEIEYLGYILPRSGIKPQQTKVVAILSIQSPTSVKTLRQFLRIVQYYRDLWEKCSANLAPFLQNADHQRQTGLHERQKPVC